MADKKMTAEEKLQVLEMEYELAYESEFERRNEDGIQMYGLWQIDRG